MDTTSFFDPYTRAVPSSIKCRLRVPLREYQWIKSLTLRDIQKLQPCEKGWGRATTRAVTRISLSVPSVRALAQPERSAPRLFGL